MCCVCSLKHSTRYLILLHLELCHCEAAEQNESEDDLLAAGLQFRSLTSQFEVTHTHQAGISQFEVTDTHTDQAGISQFEVTHTHTHQAGTSQFEVTHTHTHQAGISQFEVTHTHTRQVYSSGCDLC